MTTQQREMKYQGKVIPVTLHFDHWLPKTLGKWVGATTLGTQIYFRRVPKQTHVLSFAHECVHVASFIELQKRTWKNFYGLTLVWWLLRYLGDWITSGFRYRKMKEEVEAYEQQMNVLMGNHPDIKIPLETTQYQRGFRTME